MKLYNPFKPHLVQFSNNKYGVRVLTGFGWRYKDLTDSDYFWPKSSHYFYSNCMADDKEKAKLYMITEVRV